MIKTYKINIYILYIYIDFNRRGIGGWLRIIHFRYSILSRFYHTASHYLRHLLYSYIGLVAQSLGLSRNLRILPYLVTDYTINIKLD